jgi:predicted RecA/RadA family phage recombinase
MKNFIADGKKLTVVAPSGGITSGKLTIVGALAGVAVTTAAEGSKATVELTGVFQLAKASGAVAQGVKVYWDSTASNVTTTVGSNTFIGYAYEAAASGDTVINVDLGTL